MAQLWLYLMEAIHLVTDWVRIQEAKANSNEIAKEIHTSEGRSCSQDNYSPDTSQRQAFGRVSSHMKSNLEFAKTHAGGSANMWKMSSSLTKWKYFFLALSQRLMFGLNPTLLITPRTLFLTVKHVHIESFLNKIILVPGCNTKCKKKGKESLSDH